MQGDPLPARVWRREIPWTETSGRRDGPLWHGILSTSQPRQNLVAGEGRQDDPVGGARIELEQFRDLGRGQHGTRHPDGVEGRLDQVPRLVGGRRPSGAQEARRGGIEGAAQLLA